MVAAALSSAMVQFSFALGSLVQVNLALLLSHGGATALLLGASVFSLASTPSIFTDRAQSTNCFV